MKTVLITGASGLIGRELTGKLLSKGFCVIGTDKTVSPYSGQPNFSFIQCDITDKQKIIGVIEGSKIDALVHLACSVDNDISNVVTDKEVSASHAVDKYLYKAVANSGITDVILLSTSKVYAPPKGREPIREESPAKPSSNYAKMKLDAEKTMLSVFKKTDIKEIIVRVAPIYTKEYYQNLHDLIFSKKEQVAFLCRDGGYGLTFCNLYNLVDFIRGILSQDENSPHYHGVYNICDARIITAKEVVEFERKFHRLGAVIQMGGLAAAKALTGGRSAKQDYNYIDSSVLTVNNFVDSTKAQRFAPFRWKLDNTK